MSANKPAVPGTSAWITPPAPAAFEAQRPDGQDERYRRYPAFLRFLADDTDRAPLLAEREIWAAVRELAPRDIRRRLSTAPGLGAAASAVRDWLLFEPEIAKFMRSSDALRSPREFEGYRALEMALDYPHIEPFEVASWRITDDISLDADVTMFVAWCQGVTAAAIRRDPRYKNSYAEGLLAGLQKLHASPWTCFSLAAPFMKPVGILFPTKGYLESCARMEYLLVNTVDATDAELYYIMKTTVYTEAYDKAKHLRASVGYMNLAGGWYADFRPHALGDEFRRGGQLTFDKPTKKKQKKLAKQDRVLAEYTAARKAKRAAAAAARQAKRDRDPA